MSKGIKAAAAAKKKVPPTKVGTVSGVGAKVAAGTKRTWVEAIHTQRRGKDPLGYALNKIGEGAGADKEEKKK